MSSPKYPPWYFVLGIYSVVLVSLSWLIIHLNWPDSLLFIFLVPCMLAPFFYGRRVYWSMLAALVVAGVWVTALISLSFATSLITIAVTAGSGLAIAEGIRALTLTRARTQAVLNQQSEESRHLAEMGMALLYCDRADSVFDRLGDFLSQVTSDVIIIINQTTPDQQSLITRQVIGLEGTLWAQAEKLVGFKVIGKVSPIAPQWHEHFFQNRLEKIPGGFSALADSEISRALGQALETLLGLHDVFTIGIADRNTLWGNIHFITRRPAVNSGVPAEINLPGHLIEAVVYQCFATLSRIYAAQNLASINDMLEQTSHMARVGGWSRNLLTGEEHWSAMTKAIVEVPQDFTPASRSGILFYKEGPSRQSISEMVNRAIEQGEPFDAELQIVTAKDNERWVRVMGRPEFRDGQCIRLYGTFQDIEDRVESERALRESEARFRMLAHDLPALVCEFLPDSTLTFVNRAYCEFFDMPAAALIGRRFLDFLPEDDQVAAKQAYLSLTPQHPTNLYTHAVLKDGETHWQEWRDRAIFDKDGRAVLFQSIGVDITARKRAEQTLQQSEQQYRELYVTAQRQMHELSLLNQVRTTLARELDLPTIFRTIVEAIAEAFGYTLVSLYLREGDHLVLQHQVGYDQLIARIPVTVGVSGRVARTGEPILLQDVRTDPIFLETMPDIISEACVPLVDQGQVVGTLNIESSAPRVLTEGDLALLIALGEHVDIAIERARLYTQVRDRERHLEELVQVRTAALQAQYAQRDAILRSVGDAIFMTDAQQRILYANPAFTTLTGYTAAEVLEQDVRTLGVLQEFVPRLPAIILTLLYGEFWQGDIRVQRKDGRYYDAALTIAPMYDDAGQVTGYVFTHRDVSQAKDLERARTQFITNVSHQFLTPLTPLKTGIYLLQRTIPCEQRKQQLQLQAMQTGIDWLIHLVKDTLEILVLDSGKGVKDWAPVSLIDIVAEVLKRYQDQAQAAGLTLTAAPIPPLPAVQGDEERLVQALSELVENAVAFTAAGGHVNVTTTVEEEAWVAIAVQDTGPGITPEELPRLFERFYRGRLADSGHTTGVGLGLSIAQKIAEAHGGQITVTSTVGQGSTFTLRLRYVLPEKGNL